MAMRRYIVHCPDADSPRTRWVEGTTVEDAALAFLLDWNPDGPSDAVGLIVCNAVTGEEHGVRVRRPAEDGAHA
jgi:hypothetical protein